MRLPLLIFLLLLSACSSGTAPAILLSVTLADGRGCSDAALLAVSVEHDDAPFRFRCPQVFAPKQVLVSDLPLYDPVVVRGETVDGAELYRGSFLPSDILTGPDPATTVVLFPYAAR